MWVSYGGLLTVVILVLFFCVDAPGVEVCVSACFFSSASVSAEKLHDVF